MVGGVCIPKGTEVHIPIKQLHYDPKYWNNPEKFDPQRYIHGPCTLMLDEYYIITTALRFSPKEKAKRPSNVHLPFGVGPRNCIGKRLALLEAKMTLIELLKKFSFVQGSETKV